MAFIPLPIIDLDSTPPRRRSAGLPDALDDPRGPRPTRQTGGSQSGSQRLSRYPDPFTIRAYWKSPWRVNLIRQRIISANNRAFKIGDVDLVVLPSGKTIPDLHHPAFNGRKWRKLEKELQWLAAALNK
jgi:hypothetical protein